LRRHIGLVTQQPILFDASIGENIRYGSVDADEQAVFQASRQAHAHGFIQEQLAEGYNTRAAEHGGRLSGGQQQRIALARAILRDPALLILDEATSQVDRESERLIRLALEPLLRNRITILITHRIALLELADRILVLEDGCTIDLGTHRELMGRCELYRRLYQDGK
jgi:ABC-type multidrug transport system fused ATPase/permease subunit